MKLHQLIPTGWLVFSFPIAVMGIVGLFVDKGWPATILAVLWFWYIMRQAYKNQKAYKYGSESENEES